MSIAQSFYTPNIVETKIHSTSLDKDQKINIYLPSNYNRKSKYPVLYVLHGKDGDENSWFNGFLGISAIKINQAADRLIKDEAIQPLIIVSPQIDNSYGVNTAKTYQHVDDHDEGLYEDFIMKELIPYIDTNYSTIHNKTGRFIGGISMGGYAALHLAFAHMDMFSKVGGHSAALRMDKNVGSGIAWIFQHNRPRNELDPLFQVENLNRPDLSIYLDHGNNDHNWLIEGNKLLIHKLDDKGIAVTYKVGQGGHDYSYWSSQAENYLLFYASTE